MELATISSALDLYISDLEKQLDKHEEDKERFSKQSTWLQKNEELHWLLTQAKSAKLKIMGNLLNMKGGRTQTAQTRLLKITKEDRVGDYINFYEALELLPDELDDDEEIEVLCAAVSNGTINSFFDFDGEGRTEKKFRKQDVLRFAAFLESNMR